MDKNGVLIICFFTISILFGQVKVSQGSIERIEDFSSQYVPSRNIDVWLPENYNPKKKYAVLYMHDGQMLFDASHTWNHQEWKVDEAMSELLDSQAIRPTIVVGIWNISERRHSEYFPQKPFESISESDKKRIYETNRSAGNPLFSVPIQSDAYLKFIVEELKPYIDKKYPTKRNYKNTFIGGSSMGGLISWYAMSEYPKVFGGAICMSTHWPGIFEMENNPIPDAFLDYLTKKSPSLCKHKLYFDTGDQTLDALYPPLQKKVDAFFVEEKDSHKTIRYKSETFPCADHSEDSWADRMKIPLEWMLK